MVRSQHSLSFGEPDYSQLRPATLSQGTDAYATRKPQLAWSSATQGAGIGLLIERARKGSSSALRELYTRYTPFVYKICKRFFLPGADTEDLVQEGLTGIHHAIMTYAPERGRDFEDYASMCVRNQIVRSVRHATRRKHMLLTQASSLQAGASTLDQPSNQPGPEEQVLGALAIGDWLRLISTCLSDLEREVLHARLDGESNSDLATRLGVARKQLENALFRARRKLAAAAHQEDLLEGATVSG